MMTSCWVLTTGDGADIVTLTLEFLLKNRKQKIKFVINRQSRKNSKENKKKTNNSKQLGF